jgi:hypothetical protein
LRPASSPVALFCSGQGGRRIRVQNPCAAKNSDSQDASTSVGRLLRFVPVIMKFIDNLPVGSFLYNRTVLKFQNLITYLDDPIVIQVDYQSLNIRINFLKTIIG